MISRSLFSQFSISFKAYFKELRRDSRRPGYESVFHGMKKKIIRSLQKFNLTFKQKRVGKRPIRAFLCIQRPLAAYATEVCLCFDARMTRVDLGTNSATFPSKNKVNASWNKTFGLFGEARCCWIGSSNDSNNRDYVKYKYFLVSRNLN